MGSGKVAPRSGTASEFSLSAHSGPAGEDSRGFLNLRNVSSSLGDADAGKGHVVCLEVRGNRAVTLAEFKGETPFPSFDYAMIVVEDNGRPSDGTPDRRLA